MTTYAKAVAHAEIARLRTKIEAACERLAGAESENSIPMTVERLSRALDIVDDRSYCHHNATAILAALAALEEN